MGAFSDLDCDIQACVCDRDFAMLADPMLYGNGLIEDRIIQCYRRLHNEILTRRQLRAWIRKELAGVEA